MTVYTPIYNPQLEIHFNVSAASGKLSLMTGFNKVVSAMPVCRGSSYGNVRTQGISINHSGSIVEVFLNASAGVLNAAQGLEVVVYGVR